MAVLLGDWVTPVNGPAGCAWSAVTNATFISLTAPMSGNGPASCSSKWHLIPSARLGQAPLQLRGTRLPSIKLA